MRKNNFKNTSPWFFATMTALVFFFIGGCQMEEFNDMNEEMPYLFLTSDKPFENSNDLKTIFMAFERTNLVYNNGLYKLKQSSAKEINISDELFEFLVGSVNHTNKLILSTPPRISSPRLKSGEEEDPGDNGGGFNYSNVDCVAYSIAACAGVSFGEVNTWIRARPECYIDGVFRGVPGGLFETACKQFMQGELVPVGSINGPNFGAIIVFDLGGGNYHAVNSMYFESNSDGEFEYFDYQNRNEEGHPSHGSAPLSSIKYIFLKN